MAAAFPPRQIRKRTSKYRCSNQARASTCLRVGAICPARLSRALKHYFVLSSGKPLLPTPRPQSPSPQPPTPLLMAETDGPIPTRPTVTEPPPFANNASLQARAP
ncbi:hypothetical protein E2C01_059813 [Portunus trituberculatus]|uniref:Uncharacterized protein n=1 Tax=Portunus trituberculatus TaxID=210409 RepID=A0A5B7H7N2_PORTR|nr:hypothetical protein [Portunus trituberculatus]